VVAIVARGEKEEKKEKNGNHERRAKLKKEGSIKLNTAYPTSCGVDLSP